MGKRIITPEEKYRNDMAVLYEEAKNKKWNFKLEDFTIDENFNFTHKDWKGTYCKGGNSVAETVELINRYIEDSNKPYGTRDLSWLHLVHES